jgi:hypothetical protein
MTKVVQLRPGPHYVLITCNDWVGLLMMGNATSPAPFMPSTLEKEVGLSCVRSHPLASKSGNQAAACAAREAHSAARFCCLRGTLWLRRPRCPPRLHAVPARHAPLRRCACAMSDSLSI